MAKMLDLNELRALIFQHWAELEEKAKTIPYYEGPITGDLIRIKVGSWRKPDTSRICHKCLELRFSDGKSRFFYPGDLPADIITTLNRQTSESDFSSMVFTREELAGKSAPPREYTFVVEVTAEALVKVDYKVVAKTEQEAREAALRVNWTPQYFWKILQVRDCQVIGAKIV
jgi:hypothetical protein